MLDVAATASVQLNRPVRIRSVSTLVVLVGVELPRTARCHFIGQSVLMVSKVCYLNLYKYIIHCFGWDLKVWIVTLSTAFVSYHPIWNTKCTTITTNVWVGVSGPTWVWLWELNVGGNINAAPKYLIRLSSHQCLCLCSLYMCYPEFGLFRFMKICKF